jgi:hypothetical protein
MNLKNRKDMLVIKPTPLNQHAVQMSSAIDIKRLKYIPQNQ